VSRAAIVVVDALLMYVASVRVLRSRPTALGAAVALLLTPAHTFASGLDALWPIPFVLVWSIAVQVLVDAPSTRARASLAAGLALLPLGAARDPGVLVIVPVFVATTVVLWAHAPGWRARDLLPASVSLTAVLAMVAIGEYLLIAEPLGALRRVFQTADVRNIFLAARSSQLFWDFFLPSRWFLTPGAPAGAGLVLTPFVVPIVAGIWALVASRAPRDSERTVVATLVGAGCVGTPLAMSLLPDPYAGGRELIVIPFAVLLAAYAVSQGWWRTRPGRSVVALLAACAVLQSVAAFFYMR
jgi:hypothetical protein